MRPTLKRFAVRFAVTMAVVMTIMAIRPDVSNYLYGKGIAFYRREFSSPRIIDRYLSDHAIRKLQIGAGLNNLPGWLNTDIEPVSGQAYLDAATVFPLAEGSMHYVFAEQIIEHLTYEQGLAMLKECHRVLKSGGRIRIATPNLTRFTELLGPLQTSQMKAYVPMKLYFHSWPATPDPECYILNRQLQEFGHQFTYSPKMLQAHLHAAGFQDITTQHPGESTDPNLTDIDVRARGDFRSLNEYDTMVFEAVRP